MRSSDFVQRRAAAAQFNAANRFRKRGLALIPTKFGISFTTLFLNQVRSAGPRRALEWRVITPL